MATLSIVPERSGALVVRAGDAALVRATFSKPVSSPQVEYFVDDIERDDEPRQTVALEPMTLETVAFSFASAAFGVLGGFEVTNFHVFLVCCHIQFSCCFGLVVCVVSVIPTPNN